MKLQWITATFYCFNNKYTCTLQLTDRISIYNVAWEFFFYCNEIYIWNEYSNIIVSLNNGSLCFNHLHCNGRLDDEEELSLYISSLSLLPHRVSQAGGQRLRSKLKKHSCSSKPLMSLCHQYLHSWTMKTKQKNHSHSGFALKETAENPAVE